MIVEDGTGLENADSYVSVEFADNYFTSRGYTEWASIGEDEADSDAEKEVLLIKATDFIDNIYQWNGKKASYEQALNFPRTGLFDYNGYEVVSVPVQLKQAVCEAVKVLINGSELFNTQSENGAVINEKIGELSFSYDVSQKVKDSTLYESINSRLKGLYKDSSKQHVYAGKVERI